MFCKIFRPLIGLIFLAGVSQLEAARPYDIPALNTQAPNYAKVFSSVKIGNTVAEANNFKAGDEILSAVYAYLCTNSPVAGNTAYSDRLFVLLDYWLGECNQGRRLSDIGFYWQSAYAYMLMKHYAPSQISAARKAVYESALLKNVTKVFADSPLLYNSNYLAQLWFNGDLRLAMGVYFGSIALNDTATAEKARVAIDDVMAKTALQDGGTRYVSFWGEVASYHLDSVQCSLFWWLITGSPSMKQVVDSTLRYSVVSNEPDGFTEQSSNIPYKHMYNNRNNRITCLWKAYLYNDGYNYFFGKQEETTTSVDLLSTILFKPNRITRTPPGNVGVFFDGNNQGPRGRYNNWGWIVNGRNVQDGGPEDAAHIAAQAHDSRNCGKATFVGAYALGAIANKTSLKGAADTVLIEVKEAPGAETDLMRGTVYRYLAQDEITKTITRKNFGTLSTHYRISRRTSAPAAPNWDSYRTAWTGQQLWVMTPERIIGLMQVASDAPSTIYGLDTRIVFCGGRLNIMGSYLDLIRPDATTFEFGELRSKVHAGTFTGPVSEQRIAISDPASTDNYSALVRLNDPAVPVDVATEMPAGTRRWIVVEFTRQGNSYVTNCVNVMPANSTWAVLQFYEGARKYRIVQNLTAVEKTYTGTFIVGGNAPATSLHRSWSETVTPLVKATSSVVVSDKVPGYGHMVAVNSADAEDHMNSYRTSAEVYGAPAYLNELNTYALGNQEPVVEVFDSYAQVSYMPLRSDVHYVVEHSVNLNDWTAISTNTAPVPGQPFSVNHAFTGSNPESQFYRVTVSVPAPAL